MSFYSPNSPKNQIFLKMKKAPEEIIILNKCTKNCDEIMYGSWDMVHDRQIDGQKQWHIEVGAQPKKNIYNESIIYHK